MKKAYLIIVVSMFFVIPSMVSADVIISEIMYDLEGSDDKKEWIEIHNTGTDAIEIGKWFFYEAGIHHKLTPDVFTLLDADERALIVQDIEGIRSLYGGSIKLMRSSFSLHNTGEELGISNPQKEIVDIVTYSSEWGANGNGYSLQLTQDGSWIQGTPTPGRSNLTESESVPTVMEEDIISSDKKIEPIEFYRAYIELPQTIIAQSPIRVRMFVEYTKDKKTTELLRGYYQVNMGDGYLIESDRKIDQEYFYRYPGNYEINFEYYSSKLAFEADAPPIASSRKMIRIYDSDIFITSLDLESGITVRNNTKAHVHIGNWKISHKGKEYIFPRNSYIGAESEITIPLKVHGIIIKNHNDWVLLHNEKGITIDSFTGNQQKQINIKTLGDENVDVSQQSDISPLDKTDIYLLQHPDKNRVDFGTAKYLPEQIYTAHTKNTIPWWVIIGFGCLALFLVSIKIFLNKNSALEKETTHKEDEVIGDIELLK